MRILWLTNTPSNASEEFDCKTFGGGWISSLETLITETNKYELGICFFYDGDTFKKITKGNVVYYGVPLKMGNAFKRVIIRQLALINDEDSYFFDKVIDDFKPDLINVFGTERGYGKILLNRTERVVFNLQGLLGPITDVYFPPGFNRLKILNASNWGSLIRGTTPVHNYKLLRKKARREKKMIKYWQYFIGRTEWDRNFIGSINSEAHYFHCEEMLRREFFINEWNQPTEINENNGIVIGSTINPSLIKGLDLIYKVLNLINGYNIQWKIFGIAEKESINKIVKKILRINNNNLNITFYGQVKPNDLIKHLKTCHFFVHPSYIDNSPNSVCEAMILGMPVLSSSVGGIKTLIKNGETGFLFNPYDKYDLSGLLVNLIKNYEKAKNVGQNARQLALRRHSPEVIISDLSNIYNFVCHHNPK